MAKANNRMLILQGNLVKAILILSLPIVANNLIQTMYSLVDSYWVAKIGFVQMAAMSFVWPIQFFIISFGTGITIAGASLVSQYVGADDYKNGQVMAQQILIFGLIFSVIFSAVGYFLSPYILRWVGAEGQLYIEAKAYITIIFLELPFLFVLYGYTAINQGQGDTVTPMILTGLSVILNMILDPLFIFNLNMGIGGAAWATVLSKVPFSIYALYVLANPDRQIHINFKNLKIDKEKMKKLIKVGIPSSIGNSTMSLGFLVLNVFVVSYGDNTLAAFGVGNRINSLIFMPSAAIGSALATIIGQNLGADQINRVKEAFVKSMVMTISFLVVGGIVLAYFSEDVVRIFMKDADVVKQGTEYLKILALTCWGMGVVHCSLAMFQGSGHTAIPMLVDMTRLWLIRIPVVILVTKVLFLGADAIWWTIGLSNIATGFIAYAFTRTKIWQRKVIH